MKSSSETWVHFSWYNFFLIAIITWQLRQQNFIHNFFFYIYMDLCVLSFRSFASDAQCFVFKYFLNEFRKWILLLFIIPFGTGPLVLQTILYYTYMCLIQTLLYILVVAFFFLLSTNKQCYDIISGESSLCQLLLLLWLFAVDYKQNCLIFELFFSL